MDLDAPLDRAARAAAGTGLSWEVRAERTVRLIAQMEQGIVTDVRRSVVQGFGARLLAEGFAGYRFTTEPTPQAMDAMVAEAERVARAHARAAKEPSARPPPLAAGKAAWRSPVRRWPRQAPAETKVDLLRRAHEAASGALGRAGTVTCQWGESEGLRLLRTSDGVEARAEPVATSLDVEVTLRDGGKVSRDKASHGGAAGLERYEGDASPEALGKLAAARALEAAGARAAPAGHTRALVENVLAGVLAHESFGHLTESDVVRSGYSMLRGRLGERLGSEHATVLDTGLPETPGQGLHLPFDEQGVPSRPVKVLDRGVLRSYLHTRESAALEGVAPTGNARALDIRFPPICRMRNTYFAPGDLSEEEALEALGDGIYASGSRGGMPRADGTFLFHAERGWRVERGEKKERLQAVSLAGNILDFLKNIEGATRELRLGFFFFGGCGKWDQYGLPVGFGGPHLVLRDVYVGGASA